MKRRKEYLTDEKSEPKKQLLLQKVQEREILTQKRYSIYKRQTQLPQSGNWQKHFCTFSNIDIVLRTIVVSVFSSLLDSLVLDSNRLRQFHNKFDKEPDYCGKKM